MSIYQVSKKLQGRLLKEATHNTCFTIFPLGPWAVEKKGKINYCFCLLSIYAHKLKFSYPEHF